MARIDMVKDFILGHRSGSLAELVDAMEHSGVPSSPESVRAQMAELCGNPPTSMGEVVTAEGRGLNPVVSHQWWNHTQESGTRVVFARVVSVGNGDLLMLSSREGGLWWVSLAELSLRDALVEAANLWGGGDYALVPDGKLHALCSELGEITGVEIATYSHPPLAFQPPADFGKGVPGRADGHLRELEAESIRIIRETVAVAKNPGMLFSMGKDSMVMWTLARKAFWPEPLPFPLVIIDTRWKFQEMYRFRNWVENLEDTQAIVHINPDAIARDVNPFDFGSATHTDITKTQALKQILDTHQFDFVFGGARRDEERSRAKERVFSLRNERHGWDPRNQRPELWDVYNTTLLKGQSMRVFPLSNWTELDIWRYVEQENIPLVPLYFSQKRPFVERDGALIMVDDERFPLAEGEEIRFERIRFRTLGCYPLTGGVRSEARNVRDIITELESTRVSERSSRVIDFDPGASMEQKKKDGYF